MPTNLPPDYFEAETLYKEAQTPEEKVARLEEMISTIPKHKGTDHLRADWRRRLAKLKEAAQTRKKTGGQVSPFVIDKEGAGQVVVLGPANAGKSALVAALTNARPEVSAAPFSTWSPTPGMMLVDNVQIQLIDTPPLNADYIDPEMINLIRRADYLLLVLNLQTNPDQQLEQIIQILESYRIIPDHRESLYDSKIGLAFKPLLVLANKCDDEDTVEVYELFCELMDHEWNCLPVSAETGRNLGLLKQRLFDELGIIRIYSKAPGKEPDRSAPFVMKRGSTIEEFARKIHKDFYEKLTFARVWGSSLFDGQMVQRDYVLQDEDVVELRI
jgi:ribosome-interacting GTPase 1